MAIKMTMEDGTVIEGTAEELAKLHGLAVLGDVEDEDSTKLKTVDRDANVGERILITSAVSGEPYENGDVFTVTKADVICKGDVEVEETYKWIDGREYEVIVEEEEAKDPRDQFEKVEITDENLTFLKIGRKPGEFKKGDIVRVEDACGAPLSSGDLCEVMRDSVGMYSVTVTAKGWSVSVDKLIAPAEARVDNDA